MRNADKIQNILTDDLLATPQHISDVKQVLEFMENVAQPLSEPQVRALILLDHLGSNERLHGNKNPYDNIIKKVGNEWKKAVADTNVYLDTMQELIPKPPRPVIVTGETAGKGKK